MTEQKEIPYVDENGEINHDAKMSEKFRYFINDDEMSGTEDIIREANDKVADGNLEVQTWLDEGYGAKYFYECMRLARAVIISFENETLTASLTPEQEKLLKWMKEQTKDVQVYSFHPTGIILEVAKGTKWVPIEIHQLWVEMLEHDRQKVILEFLS